MSFFFSVVDTNDRFLRKITIGQASTEKGQIREVRCISAFTDLTNQKTSYLFCLDFVYLITII